MAGSITPTRPSRSFPTPPIARSPRSRRRRGSSRRAGSGYAGPPLAACANASSAARVTSSRAASQTSRLALDRLKLAGAEQPRPPFLRRGAGDVRHAFEPHPALRAEHLEAEARAGRRHRAEIARHAVLHPEQHRRRVVARRPPRRAGSSGSRPGRSGRRDRSCRRWRERPSASARRTASRRGVARHASGFSTSAFGKRHRRFDVQDRAELAASGSARAASSSPGWKRRL